MITFDQLKKRYPEAEKWTQEQFDSNVRRATQVAPWLKEFISIAWENFLKDNDPNAPAYLFFILLVDVIQATGDDMIEETLKKTLQ